jgi:hypothetical protein
VPLVSLVVDWRKAKRGDRVAIEKDVSTVNESILTDTVYTVIAALEVLDKLGATKLPAPRLS